MWQVKGEKGIGTHGTQKAKYPGYLVPNTQTHFGYFPNSGENIFVRPFAEFSSLFSYFLALQLYSIIASIVTRITE